MLKLKKIINKVKEIDMNNIKEIKDFYEMRDKIIDITYDQSDPKELMNLLKEINILMDDYRKNYVLKED